MGVMTPNDLLPTPEVVQLLKEEGVDIRYHRSRPVNDDLIRQADLVLGFTAIHVQTCLRRVPESKGKTFLLKEYVGLAHTGDQIHDPMGSTMEIFKKYFAEIKVSLQRLVEMEFITTPPEPKEVVIAPTITKPHSLQEDDEISGEDSDSAKRTAKPKRKAKASDSSDDEEKAPKKAARATKSAKAEKKDEKPKAATAKKSAAKKTETKASKAEAAPKKAAAKAAPKKAEAKTPAKKTAEKTPAKKAAPAKAKAADKKPAAKTAAKTATKAAAKPAAKKAAPKKAAEKAPATKKAPAAKKTAAKTTTKAAAKPAAKSKKSK